MKPESPSPGKRDRHQRGSRNTTAKPYVRLGLFFQGSSPDRGPGGRGIPPQQSGESRDRELMMELEGIYVISVAARILEMHPQTLRKYERVGLVNPSRTVGMLRLYSEGDIARLRLIKHLVGELGLNLAGVQLALGIFNQLLHMRAGLNRLEGAVLRSFLEDRLEEMFELLHAERR